jgi:hypothetical protein
LVIAFLVGVGTMTLAGKVYGQEKQNENVLLHPDKFYKKFFPKLKAKRNRNPPDSSYIKTYPNYLSVGLHILSPGIRLNVSPRGTKIPGTDPSSKFRTNIADIVGLSASYRFVSVGFAFLLKSQHTHSDYAPSHYRTATIKYNSNGYALQFKYLRFRGFTDINQSNSFDPNSRYTKRPDMVSKEFQFEFLNNFNWKKYSYIAPINFSQRQVKSRAGLLLKAGVYYNQIAGDSSIVDEKQQQYDEDFKGVKAIRTLSIKIAPGIGGNLVFLRRIYFSVAGFTSYDLYLYKYLNEIDDKVKGKQTFVLVLDGKASLGYQSKRLYTGLRYEAERRAAWLRSADVNTLYTYIGIELGYRFDTPKVVKKVYKKTMPPGM